MIKLLDRGGNIKQHLIGQTLKTNLTQKDQTFLLDKFNDYLNRYRKNNSISLIVNTATFKPEIGISLNADIDFYKIHQDTDLSKLDISF